MGFYRHDQRGGACLADEHEVKPFRREVVTVSENNFYRVEANTEAKKVSRHSIMWNAQAHDIVL